MSLNVRRVLLVSYMFPPAGGVGVQRALAFARYLPQSGAEVWVVAARNPSTPVMDPALVKLIPETTHVERVFTPEPRYAGRDRLWRGLGGGGQRPATEKPKWNPLRPLAGMVRQLLTPDTQVLWTPFAIRRAIQLIERHRIGTVLVTVPPFSTLQVGVSLKRRFPELQVISDFRDEWLSYYLNLEPGVDAASRAFQRPQAEKRERAAVEASSIVAGVTPGQVDDIRSRYPDQPPEKFQYIPNGYDPEMFVNFRSRPHGTGRIVVTFVGTVYSFSSPRPFLEAADRLPESVARRVEARFIGRIVSGQEAALVSRLGTVRILGFQPHAEALRHIEETDFLLLPVDSATAHAGKLFEYLATGKPILAPTPPHGEIARLLAETGGGWTADPQDPAAMDAMLRTALEAVEQGRFAPKREAIEEYTRPKLVRRMAEVAGLCDISGLNSAAD